MLVRCLYASRSAEPIAGKLLDEILKQSQTHNPEMGITGLLCHAEDTFVQVIEGGRDAVCELFNSIVRDDRHRNVRLLVFEEIEERRFGSWTMGEVNLETLNPALLLKYSERLQLDPFKNSGRATMALLMELVSTGSILSRGTAGPR